MGASGHEHASALSLVLVDSELEMVPREFWSHPAVVSNASRRRKKPSRVLLDSSYHHSFLRDPEEKNRRGRPDMVHQFLLMGLDSILNLEGALRLHVHTRNDEWISISPETRLPKNFNRFSGLFEELFRSGSVPAGREPLIRLERGMDIRAVLERARNDVPDIGRKHVILFSASGRPVLIADELKRMMHDAPIHLICMIGGFPAGDFISDAASLADDVISIFGEEIKIWAVEMELISAFRTESIRGSRTSGEA